MRTGPEASLAAGQERFAENPARSFVPGEPLFQVGDHGVPTWFLLGEGAAVVARIHSMPGASATTA